MCASASLTAFITAGIAAIVPASPTPLTPSGFFLGQGRVARNLEVAELVGARHTIVLERTAEELAGGLVVEQILH